MTFYNRFIRAYKNNPLKRLGGCRLCSTTYSILYCRLFSTSDDVIKKNKYIYVNKIITDYIPVI